MTTGQPSERTRTRLHRLRPDRDVREAHDPANSFPRDFGGDGVEGREVTVMSAINASRTNLRVAINATGSATRSQERNGRAGLCPPPRYDCAVPSLLVTGGPLSGHELVVEYQLVLGRGHADIVIDDAEISRRHALMSKRDGAIEIEDLDSLNGTWVNEQRIASAVRLAPGDVIRLGQTTIEVNAPRPAVTEYEQRPLIEPDVAPAPLETPPSVGRSAVVSIQAGRCPECDAEVQSQARFCSNCGVVITAGGRTCLPCIPLVSTRSRRPTTPTSCAPSPPYSPTSSARPRSASDWHRTR